ncbi:MAG: hypothetical protein AMJ73_10220 [candidate division Zixibacteria bacterium SM1_73]|nr:MAG: hypothetical protein AMJ73_10220 [candidate division Zixibacteria bacterium SM1_73]
MDINSLLRRIKLNPFADYSNLPWRQEEALSAISQIIASGEALSEGTIKLRISKTTDVKNVVWSLWKRGVLIT